jgi:hypothetical protein
MMKRVNGLPATMLRTSILALAFAASFSHVALGADISTDAIPPGYSREIPNLKTADEYVNGSAGTENELTGIELLGITVIIGTAQLKEGGTVQGVRVCSVMAGTSGAVAGLRGEEDGVAAVLTVGFFAASMFFPPALLGALAVHELRIGEAYDLIIAVDGRRTHNVVELREALTPVTAGELVYLVVVRNGRRDYIAAAIQ